MRLLGDKSTLQLALNIAENKKAMKTQLVKAAYNVKLWREISMRY